ncbi:hypothetical protein PGTUg99_023434 [Puccinia graminis f. sp. tritici]|uniref:CCHC-type domain-containing protein n=1 Tax=Puccinia graminis f. sp. tritici TaxID=56615 RepID=A0A5B0RK59_PUCGR|nr:hypothetical protein PGTUg99_023434 [Puccinia graminis f. sp. tritici]
MEEAFDKAHFDPEINKPLTWFSKQKDRLSAIFPEMSPSGLHERILKKCGGDLEHAVKCRTNRNSSTEEIINALEDIVERTKIGRSYKKYSPGKTDIKKTIPEKIDNKPYVRKCHKCDSPDHLANVCPKNKRTINAIEPDTSGNTEELDDKSDKEDDESLPDDAEEYESADAEIGAIEADYDLSEEEQ